jgi:hypothetical protein
MSPHRSLYHRSKPIAFDVAEAITAICTADTAGMPLAIEREQIARELVRIANTNDAKEVIELSASTEKLVEDNFKHVLATSGVFQAGYKHYEKNTGHQIVPVTEFFFKVVYDDGSRELLLNLEDFQIEQSLPRRQWQPYDENDNPLQIEGDRVLLVSGKIAGIVVYPNGMRANLLTAWLQRLMTFSVGQGRSFVRRVENARPEAEAVEALRETTNEYSRNARLALPRKK